ncbi:ras guanine nucleotide exchange factor A-like [Amphiura filiformis]|uniref:ras guanine nucleotide exchange factor A-like n=1 Tax=Amphiura filiformis TaxID=82378 RepID=UPI003B20C2FC
MKATDSSKYSILHVANLPEWAVDLPERVTMIADVSPEAMARELTLIDKELFLMIHESELVDCMWMKPDKHSKAPNVMRLIEFFERVVRTVSAEIVKKNYDWARASAMAYFTTVAEKCFELQNFHSLKAILCGMQVPSIYRLQYSWCDFEEQYPDEHKVYNKLAHLMVDEGCSPEYFAHLERAELNPPLLTIPWSFLQEFNWSLHC